jgi:hypothetical protein
MPKELFNLRHSARRASAIEIAWGLLKSRFKILLRGIVAKDIDTVTLIILACAVIHNFIQRRCQPPSGSAPLGTPTQSQSHTAYNDTVAAAAFQQLIMEERELQAEELLKEVDIYRAAHDAASTFGVDDLQAGVAADTSFNADSSDMDDDEPLNDMYTAPPTAVEVESRDAAEWRDSIAQIMWNDYQAILSARSATANQSGTSLLQAEMPFRMEYLRTAYILKAAFTPIDECYGTNAGKRLSKKNKNSAVYH